MTERQTEALERLNRGIEDSRVEVQKRTMNLAQGYFDDSAETLKQQIGENRAALEGLPDQIPGGRDEAFQMMFQELMDNYTAMEQCIDEAQARVADLDVENIRRQGEVDATDAARRDAKELGIDLTEIEGTGSEGRITVDNVKEYAEKMRSGEITDQAQNAAEDAAGQATEQAGQVANQAQDAAGGAAQQAQDAAGQAAGQAQEVAGQATDQAGQVAGQATDAVGGLTGGLTGGGDGDGQGGGGPLGGVTDQVGQVAGQATDQVGQVAGQAQEVAGDAAGQAQDAAGQATDQAGQVANQAQDAAGSAAQQAQDAAGQAKEQARQVAGGPDDVPEKDIAVSDAARREAREKGIDLSTIKGTGADGRIVYWDVADLPSQKEDDPAEQVAGQAQEVAGQVTDQVGQVAGQAQEAAGQATDQANGGEPKITKAAKRKAQDMGKDISQIQGSGVGGLITISDVVRA